AHHVPRQGEYHARAGLGGAQRGRGQGLRLHGGDDVYILGHADEGGQAHGDGAGAQRHDGVGARGAALGAAVRQGGPCAHGRRCGHGIRELTGGGGAHAQGAVFAAAAGGGRGAVRVCVGERVRGAGAAAICDGGGRAGGGRAAGAAGAAGRGGHGRRAAGRDARGHGAALADPVV